MVGPLADPMFVGSPGAGGGGMGLGGGGDQGNLGMETVSRVLIPNCKIGAVIGKGGAIIKHIREVGEWGGGWWDLMMGTIRQQLREVASPAVCVGLVCMCLPLFFEYFVVNPSLGG